MFGQVLVGSGGPLGSHAPPTCCLDFSTELTVVAGPALCAAQVVQAQIVVDRPRGPKGQPLKVAECIVGDESGTIVFTARNEQGT